jgi:hypothetical protein
MGYGLAEYPIIDNMHAISPQPDENLPTTNNAARILITNLTTVKEQNR